MMTMAEIKRQIRALGVMEGLTLHCRLGSVHLERQQEAGGWLVFAGSEYVFLSGHTAGDAADFAGWYAAEYRGGVRALSPLAPGSLLAIWEADPWAERCTLPRRTARTVGGRNSPGATHEEVE